MAERSLTVGVYVVTAAGLVPGRTHVDVARAAAAGGADVVQLRAPELAAADLVAVAREVVAAVAGFDTLTIVNDDVEAAMTAGADGVHLGQADLRARGLTVAAARRRVGGQVLGISADTVAEATEAVAGGADYLGVTVWATGTKGDARPQGLAGLRAIASAIDVPVVAIGGLDAASVPEILAAGATGVAVVSAVAGARDPAAATRRLRAAVAAGR